MRIRPFILASLAATTSVLLAPFSSASAVGNASVGSTLTATAWERGGLDDFSYDYVADGLPTYPVVPDGGFEEYVYRIYDGSASVDVQNNSGYDGLTEAEQYEWYEDAGYAPYEFRWTAFTCLGVFDVGSSEILIPDEITLSNMHYVAADSLFPTAGREYFDDYLYSFRPSLEDGSVFRVDDFIQDHLSSTGYTAVMDITGEPSVAVPDMAFSASYPEFDCGVDAQLYGFTILDSASTTDRATERDLDIDEILHVDAFGDARELEADGVFIGVTGGGPTPFEHNAALWGMTEIDGERGNSEPLANTGGQHSSIAALAGVSALIASLAIATRVARRRV
jgi:LPXTG-motif cell wall-anchored protein